MTKPDSSARITVLRRYISLLTLEEKRLNWILASTTAAYLQRADAERDVSAISEKLRKAARELSDLELKR